MNDNPATEQARILRAEKERKAAVAERQEDFDLRNILATVAGRRFLRRVLKICKHEEDAGNPTSSMVYQNLGRQAVARELVKEMKAVSLESYFLLLKEQENEVKSKKNMKGGTE
jgi:hypothetical protein